MTRNSGRPIVAQAAERAATTMPAMWARENIASDSPDQGNDLVDDQGNDLVDDQGNNLVWS